MSKSMEELMHNGEFFERLAEIELSDWRAIQDIPDDEPLDGDQVEEVIENFAECLRDAMNQQEGNW